MFQQRNGRNISNTRGLRHKDLNEVGKLTEAYENELNWYTELPREEITIEEFEEFAMDRLAVLRALESADLRNKVGRELEEIFTRVTREHLPLSQLTDTFDNFPNLRKDHLSHFVLRLAFCRSSELRAWFIKYEERLFSLRYNRASQQARTQFIDKYGFTYERVSEEEKQLYRNEINSTKFGGYGRDYDVEEFLKIPFDKIPKLIQSRQVFLKDGYAYVPNEYSLSWISTEFKNNLRDGLLKLSKVLPQIDDDERLEPILRVLANRSFSTYDAVKSEKESGKISVQDVEILEPHFPLCMKNLYKHLKKDKHLKHGGRMQLGLFLKGIGLPLEEALQFWRMAFVKLNDEEFKKGYAYNIRHNYGQEGSRKDYTAYSCDKILGSAPGGADQHHGCPFKHFNGEKLKREIQELNPMITTDEIRDIIELVKKKHYTTACTKYFEIIKGNGTSLEAPIVHPNQYFELSSGISKKRKID